MRAVLFRQLLFCQGQSVRVVPWQDVVFAAGMACFALALIPTLRTKQYPARPTCVLTASILLVFAVTDFTLKLWLAGALAIVSALLWAYMAIKN